ncbi:MAG: DUF4349 domain-containing protein [Pseudomonadota bacterium]
MKHLGIAMTALALAACGGGSGDYESNESYGGVAVEESYSKVTNAAPPAPPAPSMDPSAGLEPPVDGTPAPEAGEQYIAYRHALSLRLPARQVAVIMERQAEACRAAGVETCIITNSTVNNSSEDWVYASLNLRAQPDWIETFLAGVDAEAEGAGGEVSSRTTSSEDLTRQIIDTDARLRAKIELRERLEELLGTQEAELSDLLNIERELSRVNSEIESSTSYLKALRLRVSMSELNISYETKPAVVSSSTFDPLSRAFGGFFRTLFEAVGAVVTAFAIGLPWLLLIGALLWVWLRLIWPRIRRKKKA